MLLYTDMISGSGYCRLQSKKLSIRIGYHSKQMTEAGVNSKSSFNRSDPCLNVVNTVKKRLVPCKEMVILAYTINQAKNKPRPPYTERFRSDSTMSA